MPGGLDTKWSCISSQSPGTPEAGVPGRLDVLFITHIYRQFPPIPGVYGVPGMLNALRAHKRSYARAQKSEIDGSNLGLTLTHIFLSPLNDDILRGRLGGHSGGMKRYW